MIYIEMLNEVESYQQAIRITCDILHRKGIVNQGYYSMIMKGIEKYGGYFYLGKGICMPHAGLSTEVKDTAACFLKLKKPVQFYGHDVTIFFTFVVQNQEKHFHFLQNIAKVFSDADKLRVLKATEDEKVIKKILGE